MLRWYNFHYKLFQVFFYLKKAHVLAVFIWNGSEFQIFGPSKDKPLVPNFWLFGCKTSKLIFHCWLADILDRFSLAFLGY